MHASTGWPAGVVLMAMEAASAVVPAQAAATRLYYFNADCVDCSIASHVGKYGVLGILKLRNYDDGLPIDAFTFSDFSYSGSNLVGAYHVGIDAQDGVTETLDFEFRTDAGSPDTVSGAMRFSFDIRFGDDLGFHADSSGNWYTCAPGPGWPAGGAAYRAGNDCTQFSNADHGTGFWSDTATVALGPGEALPEPSTAALVALALGCVMLRQRRC